MHDKAASRVKLSLRDAEAVHLPVHEYPPPPRIESHGWCKHPPPPPQHSQVQARVRNSQHSEFALQMQKDVPSSEVSRKGSPTSETSLTGTGSRLTPKVPRAGFKETGPDRYKAGVGSGVTWRFDSLRVRGTRPRPMSPNLWLFEGEDPPWLFGSRVMWRARLPGLLRAARQHRLGGRPGETP